MLPWVIGRGQGTRPDRPCGVRTADQSLARPHHARERLMRRPAEDKTKDKGKTKDKKKTNPPCTPGAGCPNSVCPVIKYADYGAYCSYYAQYCTGSSTNLVNVSIDDACNHTCNPPFCCSDDCSDCIPVPRFKDRKNK